MTDVTPAGDLTEGNRTSYLHSQRHWFCRRPHDWHHPTLDPIFYRFERGDRPFRQDTIGPLRWRGNIVLNHKDLCVDQHILFAICDTLTVDIIESCQTTLICHSPYHPKSYVRFGFFHLHLLLLDSISIMAEHWAKFGIDTKFQQEGWRMEAIMRLDERISAEDFRDRMPTRKNGQPPRKYLLESFISLRTAVTFIEPRG